MILEGLAVTPSPAGRPHLAPLGAVWPDDAGPDRGDRFTLRPYEGSRTCGNLLRAGRGVWHTTDDAVLIARSAAGLPGLEDEDVTFARDPRTGLHVLMPCQDWWAFEVVERAGPDARGMHTLTAEVTARGGARASRGFCRASHALVEAAILCSRVRFFPRAELDRRLADLAPLVAKTGTPRDRAAWADVCRVIGERAAADEVERADG